MREVRLCTPRVPFFLYSGLGGQGMVEGRVAVPLVGWKGIDETYDLKFCTFLNDIVLLKYLLFFFFKVVIEIEKIPISNQQIRE